MGADYPLPVRTHGIFLSKAPVVLYEINVPTQTPASIAPAALSSP